MNYKKIYYNIINNNNLESPDQYRELHHIIPKCLGGIDHTSNLVSLSAREHFICHKLLCKIYPKNRKLKFALWRLIHGNDFKTKLNSRSYSKTKELLRDDFKEMFSGEGNPFYGKTHSLKTKRKISKSKKSKNFKILDSEDNILWSGHCKSECTKLFGLTRQTILRMINDGNPRNGMRAI